jgi:hypothetical protein
MGLHTQRTETQICAGHQTQETQIQDAGHVSTYKYLHTQTVKTNILLQCNHTEHIESHQL